MNAVQQPAYRLADFLMHLETSGVRARVVSAGSRQGFSESASLAQARTIARGIAANFSFPVARAGDRFLSWVFARVFDGIDVRNLDAVRRLPPDATIVYLPCHRSHLDYLVLSHVIYHGGLLPPHIAAGDNMNLPVLGRLLRMGGGFFMRRSFKGDPLYSTVFAAYLEGLLERGLPIEFFIEGGRSRTGRTLPPKTGLLGMLAAAFMRQPGRPLILVPVYLGYEKLPEGPSFVRELAGHPKRSESLWDVAAASRVLFQKYGMPCVSVGEPLSIGAWLDAVEPGWRTLHDDNPSPIRPLVAQLAAEVVRRIDAAAVLTPINLVAMALLEMPGATASVSSLTSRIETLRKSVAQRAPSLASRACIERALRLEMIDVHDGIVSAPGEKAALLDYFRQNVLHLFPSLGIDPKESP